MNVGEKTREVWGSLLDGLKFIEPRVYNSIIHYYPISISELFIRTSDEDGCKEYIYNWITRSLRITHKVDPESIYSNETEWRKYFARKLREMMYIKNVPAYELSTRVEISEVTISKYLNAKATPSAYNLVRIEQALGCAPNELTYFEELERNYDHA